MVFVGNTDHSVSYMIKHSTLFDSLPKDYYDTAFLDRIHAYLPGWEVQKLRNEMFTSDYGFIVDYLAEILKYLRKEDRTNDHTQFFELSDSISTRDKTSIAKTFSGLAKVIYPDGNLPEKDAKEILDFAIENRKRVKQELRKMDETFEEVDFSYVCKKSGEHVFVETLEETEYGTTRHNPAEIIPETNDEGQGSGQNSENEVALREGQIIIRDNQSGISYEKLFGAYLQNAQNIQVIDPYIRLPYQLRNFMEFATLVSQKKDPESEVKLHLTTNNNEDFISDAKEAFAQMIMSLESIGIIFNYEFDNHIHDRSILIDNTWKIVLGRGLDLWQKTGGWYDINEYIQEKRICKACEITYMKI